MSAPTSGSADSSPTAGYYPDPSIPGYIRYWNGASWVPGTSRPAPGEGDAMPAPPPGAATVPAQAAPAAPASLSPDETGPVFFDEDPEAAAAQSVGEPLPELRPRGEVDVPQPAAADWDDPRRLHGNRPQPAAAWHADATQQSGSGEGMARRVSWGAGPADAPGAGGTGPARKSVV